MSSSNGGSPVHLPSRCHSNIVNDQECESWFDSDGRLVKEAVMREALFHVGVVSPHRRRLWKFLFEIYPMNSTRRDQKTIDLENRANYIALRQRWEVLDKTIEVPDQEPTIHNTPSYLELSDDDIRDTIYSMSKTNKLDGSKVKGAIKEQTDSATGNNDKDLLESLEASLDQSGESRVCSRCHRLIGSYCSSLSDSTTTNSESGYEGSSTMDGSVSPNTSPKHTCAQASHPKGCHGNVIPGETSDQCGICLKRAVGEKQCSCDFRKSFDESLDQEGVALLKILDFPSRVYAARQPVDLEVGYPKAKRIVLRDVSRTDRNYHYFSHKRNLRKVHRILMIYSMFHPDLGYAQGMNDILARFLVVTDSEVDSYWMFVKYMDKKRADFMEDSMMGKVALVKKLIKEIDRELYSFFEKSECQDYLFCHRWLLLDFKREFLFEESIRIFEVLSTHYLELNSDKALLETDKVIAKEFALDAGEIRSERADINLEFTFDLFISVAILTMNSHEICKASDAAGIYGCLNGLSMNMNLSEVLTQAEELFYKYCRLSVTRGFSEIEV